MDSASDPVAYMLSLPMAGKPGKKFEYNGGATQLLAAIIQKATGQPIDEFARQYLFSPLGMIHFKWETTTGSNMPDAFSGLHMTSRDLLRFGLLYMHDGNWKGRQIISKEWIQQSTTPFIIVDDGSDIQYGKSFYGFQWWQLPDTISNKPILISACIGNGGQRIFIDKENQLVVVFTGGNYRRPDLYLNPYKMLNEFIYPAILTSKK